MVWLFVVDAEVVPYFVLFLFLVAVLLGVAVVLVKKNIVKKFHFFALQTKNAVNQRVFKIFPKFFFYMVSYYPLILYGV